LQENNILRMSAFLVTFLCLSQQMSAVRREQAAGGFRDIVMSTEHHMIEK